MAIYVPKVSAQPVVQQPVQGGAPSSAFGGLEAQASQGLGQSISRQGDILFQTQQRNEGLYRDDDDLAYIDAVTGQYRNMQATNNFSPEAMEEAQAFADKTKNDILSSHRGSRESRAMLESKLNARQAQFMDDISVEKLSHDNEAQSQRYNAAINENVNAVREDPRSINSSFTVKDVLEDHLLNFEERMDYMGVDPFTRQALIPKATALMAEGMFDAAMRTGDYDRAYDILGSEDLVEVLDLGQRRNMEARILQSQEALKNNALKRKLSFVEFNGQLYGLDQSTGEVVTSIEGMAGGEVDVSGENSVRGQYNNLSEDFITIRDSYGKMRNAFETPGAAGDILLITSYMKLLDPGSTVREGEFQLSAGAGSLAQKALGLANRVLSGERLTVTQRNDFAQQSHQIFQTQLERQSSLQENYVQIADLSGLNSTRVVPDFIGESKDWPAVYTDPDTGAITKNIPQKSVDEIRKLATGLGLIKPETSQPAPEVVETLEGVTSELGKVVGNALEMLPSKDEIEALGVDELVKLMEDLDLTDPETFDKIRIQAPGIYDAIVAKFSAAPIEGEE